MTEISSASKSQREQRKSRMRKTSAFFRASPAKRIHSPWTERGRRNNANKITPRPPEGLIKSAQKVFSVSVFSSQTFNDECSTSKTNAQPDQRNVQRLKIHRHADANTRTSGRTFTSVVPIGPMLLFPNAPTQNQQALYQRTSSTARPDLAACGALLLARRVPNPPTSLAPLKPLAPLIPTPPFVQPFKELFRGPADQIIGCPKWNRQLPFAMLAFPVKDCALRNGMMAYVAAPHAALVKMIRTGPHSGRGRLDG